MVLSADEYLFLSAFEALHTLAAASADEQVKRRVKKANRLLKSASKDDTIAFQDEILQFMAHVYSPDCTDYSSLIEAKKNFDKLFTESFKDYKAPCEKRSTDINDITRANRALEEMLGEIDDKYGDDAHIAYGKVKDALDEINKCRYNAASASTLQGQRITSITL